MPEGHARSSTCHLEPDESHMCKASQRRDDEVSCRALKSRMGSRKRWGPLGTIRVLWAFGALESWATLVHYALVSAVPVQQDVFIFIVLAYADEWSPG